jgi:hypothetical protein
MTQGAFTLRLGPGRAGRTLRAPLAIAALLHVLLVAMLLQSRLPLPPISPTIVETTLLALPPPRSTPAPAPARLPAHRPRPLVAPETLPLHLPPVPDVIVAAPLPASAPSAPQPALRLDLSPTALRAIVAAHRPGLAETISSAGPPPSALSRIAGVGNALSERRLPDGSIETTIHGECYVQEQSVASRLDPIGHAHDAPLVRGCDR